MIVKITINYMYINVQNFTCTWQCIYLIGMNSGFKCVNETKQ